MSDLLGQIGNPRFSQIAKWFLPNEATTLVEAFSSLIGDLKPVDNDDDALLQIISMMPALKMSPNLLVQEVMIELEKHPDSTLMKLLVKAHAAVQNPLDFVVYLHTPEFASKAYMLAPHLFEEVDGLNTSGDQSLVII